MKVYWIECGSCGIRWSRNRWATKTAAPDLFVRRSNAEAQWTQGKIGTHGKLFGYSDNTHYSYAKVVKGELNET